MVEYELQNKHCCSYVHNTDIIRLGMGNAPDKLSNDELIKLVSDNLIHEHIHMILDHQFDATTCKLFDGIQQYFRNAELHEKIVDGAINETYHKFIKREGFNAFLDYRNISHAEIERAYIICNKRNGGI